MNLFSDCEKFCTDLWVFPRNVTVSTEQNDSL